MKLLPLLSFALSTTLSLAQFSWEDHYDVEVIPLPKNLDPQIGGLDLNADGELVSCFHRGEVMIYNEEKKQWRPFASGLHEPLGLLVEDDGNILIVQRGEITRLIDSNKDGIADQYLTICDDWGLTGNYHEFAFGLVKDSQQNLYLALGTASNGSGVREEIRGQWKQTEDLTHQRFLYGGKHGDWKEKKKGTPRMYARVPYRGCVLKVNATGKDGSGKVTYSRKAQLYATGLRTPNGLYLDQDDQLWISDNQGDWVGASKLHRIEEGQFHGHADSLLWGDNPPTTTPADLPIPELESRRIKAAALLPQGDCGNSITQMLPLSSSFAPVKGENGLLIIGEMNHSRLPLYYPDLVNGHHQGAVSHFYNTSGLGMGNNRMVYDPSGKSLYIGKTHLSWPGAEGIKKLTYKGKPFFQVQQFKLHPKGFEIHFNNRVKNSKRPKEYLVKSYEILYHAHYGSPKHNPRKEKVINVENKGTHIIVELETPPEAGKVYDIAFPSALTSESLGSLSSNRYWYTAHKVYKQ